ncbi:MAG: hypothetical protein IPO62_07425 [Saprospiraceae bacterium]|nr:hypothetical protein [Saprospiraceae bacterium]MBK9630884.1 hypothetical protein [Saprospiraceae bacterium]
MKAAILKFSGIFLICYLICLGLFTQSFIGNAAYKLLRGISTKSIQWVLPSAHIESQEYIDPSSGKKDPSAMYLVYGNPLLIKKAMDEARKSGQSQANIPTRSIVFRLFEMFLVPILFLISIFVATPLTIKEKLKGLCCSLVILLLFLVLRCIILAMFNISNDQIGIYEYSNGTMDNLSFLVSVFTLGFNMSLAFVLWLYFGFRKSSFSTYFVSLFNQLKS